MTRGTPPDTSYTRAAAVWSNSDAGACPRHREPVGDVAADLVGRDWLQAAARRDTLVPFTERGPAERLVERRLADQNDLQRRFVADILCEHADLAEHLDRQVVGIVDDDDGERLQGGEGHEKIVQRSRELGP